MNDVCHEWVRKTLTAQRPDRRLSVVEIGSRDINGGVRDLFPRDAYTGVDLIDGPGVDVVADGREWHPEYPVDVALCLNVLEHTPDAAGLVAASAGMIVHGGLLFLAAPAAPWPAHSAIDGNALRPGEYYQNRTAEEIAEWLDGFSDKRIEVRGGQLFAVARKGGQLMPEPPKPSGVFITCSDCNRVLLKEHGPCCPECLAVREATKPKIRLGSVQLEEPEE